MSGAEQLWALIARAEYPTATHQDISKHFNVELADVKAAVLKPEVKKTRSGRLHMDQNRLNRRLFFACYEFGYETTFELHLPTRSAVVHDPVADLRESDTAHRYTVAYQHLHAWITHELWDEVRTLVHNGTPFAELHAAIERVLGDGLQRAQIESAVDDTLRRLSRG